MRYVLFTYPDPDYAARWEEMTEAERQAETARHEAWFMRYGERVVGGADLAWPKVIRTVRKRRKGEPVITDGPFIEGKEVLGGVVIVEAGSFDEAVGMASSGRHSTRVPEPASRSRPSPTIRLGAAGVPPRMTPYARQEGLNSPEASPKPHMHAEQIMWGWRVRIAELVPAGKTFGALR